MGANFVDDESGDLLRSSVGSMQLPVSLQLAPRAQAWFVPV